jgi:energy-coupling factor transport system permease protein
MVLSHLDPRTKLALGLMAIGAVFVAREPGTLLVEFIVILLCLYFLGMWRAWLHSLRFVLPMVGLVFVIGFLSFDIWTSLVLSIRLINLLNVCFIFFRSVSPEEMGGGLNKMGIPYGFTFILTTAMRYVPLIGLKIRHIVDAQSSRGIDLRFKLRNVTNFMALLMPLLVQSFVLSDELAMAMESRGFARKGRSSRKHYRFNLWDYGLMILSLTLLVFFIWWERG